MKEDVSTSPVAAKAVTEQRQHITAIVVIERIAFFEILQPLERFLCALSESAFVLVISRPSNLIFYDYHFNSASQKSRQTDR
jgi:hypothetical protein